MENILKGIKAFIFDVDGVLTDGGIFADLSGELFRTFDSKDGFALRMAYMHGYRLGGHLRQALQAGLRQLH